MAPQKPTKPLPQERVRNEVYGMRLEHVIEDAMPAPTAAQPAPAEPTATKQEPESQAWQTIEDQMANPTPGARRRNRRG